MATSKVIINYLGLKMADLLTTCKTIMQSMTGNPNFINPDPSMAEYGSLVTEFDQAIIDAQSRDRYAVARKDTLQAKLVQMTRNLGNYVNTTSKGDLDMLASSGFKMAKTPERSHLATPEKPIILQGQNPGSLLIKQIPPKGANCYLYQMTSDPVSKDSVWITKGSKLSSYEFSGLTQGAKYWFRVVALGSRKQEAYGPVVSQYVMQRSED